MLVKEVVHLDDDTPEEQKEIEDEGELDLDELASGTDETPDELDDATEAYSHMNGMPFQMQSMSQGM